MTLNNRMAFHRMFKRQGLFGGNGKIKDGGISGQDLNPTGDSSTAATTTSQLPANPGDVTSSISSSSSTPPPNSHNSHTHTTDSSSQPIPTTTSTTDTPSPTSTTPSSTPSDTPTSTSTSSTLSTTTVAKPSATTPTTVPIVATLTGPAVTQTQLSVPNPLLTGSTATPSSTSVPASGGISTGTIVGSVAGGIAGIVLLGIILAFFLRRWRRHNASDIDFNAEDFNAPTTDYSEVIGGPTHRVSTFDPSPPMMTQLHGHGTTPSMSSAGMAGQGAYPYAAGAAGAGAGAMLHERQNYTYGTQYDVAAREEDAMGGPYSSQPQAQAAYNTEAYGSYAVVDDHNGGQQAYPAYQAQVPSQQAHAYTSDDAPALVPGAHAVPATRSAISMEHEEAYGGY